MDELRSANGSLVEKLQIARNALRGVRSTRPPRNSGDTTTQQGEAVDGSPQTQQEDAYESDFDVDVPPTDDTPAKVRNQKNIPHCPSVFQGSSTSPQKTSPRSPPKRIATERNQTAIEYKVQCDRLKTRLAAKIAENKKLTLALSEVRNELQKPGSRRGSTEDATLQQREWQVSEAIR